MTSQHERERRYRALRAAMAIQGIDALLVYGRGGTAGRIHYLTDVRLPDARCLLFPEGPPVLVYELIGVRLWANASGWELEQRQAANPAAGVADVLRERGCAAGAIGVIGMDSTMPLADLRALEERLPNATMADETDLFDGIRMVKSPEELVALRDTGRMMREAYGALETVLRPGVTERQVVGEHYRALRELGSYDGWVNIRRPPFQTSGPPTNYRFDRDDLIVVYSEQSGPDGYWNEVQRCYCFGPPPVDVVDVWGRLVDAYQECLEVMRPGASSDAIFAAMDRNYQRVGYDTRSVHAQVAHGIGLDASERPFVPGDDVELEAGMTFALHPPIHFDASERAKRYGGLNITDTVVITRSGAEMLAFPDFEWVALE